MSTRTQEQARIFSMASPLMTAFGLLFVLFGLLHAQPVLAQDAQHEQLQEYIERNRELLDWAYDVVRDTENMPARKVLEEALNLHRRSIRLMDDYPLMSYKTAKGSRTAMRNAVRLARESMGYDERIRLRSERFRDQHAHLLEKAREANNQQALDFLRRSESMGIRAYEQYQQGDARLAFKMLEQAEELMNRAARMLARDGGADRLDRQIEMARLALERAQEKLENSADPAARKLLTESDEALDRALEFRDQGQPGSALQMAGIAQRLANRAATGGLNGLNREVVLRQIERWDERSERVTEMVRDARNDTAVRLLERAREHRAGAGQSLDQDEIETALRRIRAAHDLLTQAEDMVR